MQFAVARCVCFVQIFDCNHKLPKYMEYVGSEVKKMLKYRNTLAFNILTLDLARLRFDCQFCFGNKMPVSTTSLKLD